MRSRVTNGLPDRDRDCRQSLVAIIEIRSLPHRGQCNPISDLVVRIPNGDVAQLVSSDIFIGFTFRATFNTCMHLKGVTFHNRSRLEDRKKCDSNSKMHGILIKHGYVSGLPNYRP